MPYGYCIWTKSESGKFYQNINNDKQLFLLDYFAVQNRMHEMCDRTEDNYYFLIETDKNARYFYRKLKYITYWTFLIIWTVGNYYS